MKRPSKHFTWAEMACRDGTPYPGEWRETRLPLLLSAAEAIRGACGDKPLLVFSAYRTPKHNRRIGGARRSQHMQGRALDLRPPKRWSVDRFHKAIKSLKLPQIRGLGKYRTFVHIDTRPSQRLAAWSGSGKKDAVCLVMHK